MRERKSEYQTVGRDYKSEREGGSERRGERPDRTRTTKKKRDDEEDGFVQISALAHRNPIIYLASQFFSWAFFFLVYQVCEEDARGFVFGRRNKHGTARHKFVAPTTARDHSVPARLSRGYLLRPPLWHLLLTTVSLPSMELITLQDARREPITFLYATERRLRSSTESSLGCCATAFMWSTISSKLNRGGRYTSARPAEEDEGLKVKGLLS